MTTMTIMKLPLTLLIVLMTFSNNIRNCQAFFMGNKIGNLKVGALYVRHFGQNYISGKEKAMSNLVKILSRYDIFLLQGTKDSSETALDLLRDRLNSTTAESWSYVASAPLGRSKGYQERYAFFYRTNSAQVVTSYQIDDTSKDVYAREPFCVEFAFISSSQSHSEAPIHRENVVLLGLHTPTDKTRQELQELASTVKSVAGIYPGSSGVVAMGNMNADCRYLTSKWRKSLEMFNGEGLRSLIPDTADTLVKGTSDCAYDRLVVYGKDLDVGDASVMDFKTDLGLKEKDALDITDHFPVEFVLY